MAANNPPTLHHYIPQFLLREWIVKGRLFRYLEPRPGKVVEHLKPTSAVGAKERLYEMSGVPAEMAQLIESDFLRILDNAAADAHKLILAKNFAALNSKARSAWTNFILSLFIRGPDALAAYKAGFKAVYDKPNPATQAKYEAMKAPNDPPTVEEFFEKFFPDRGTTEAMKQFPGVLQNEDLGKHVINMGWNVLEIDAGAFLMSDAPLVMSNEIGRPEGHLTLPISPRHLFVATNNRQTLNWIKGMGAKAIVRRTNELVVGRARHFVVADDHRQRRFIENRFGKSQEKSIAELFSEKYMSPEAT